MAEWLLLLLLVTGDGHCACLASTFAFADGYGPGSFTRDLALDDSRVQISRGRLLEHHYRFVFDVLQGLIDLFKQFFIFLHVIEFLVHHIQLLPRALISALQICQEIGRDVADVVWIHFSRRVCIVVRRLVLSRRDRFFGTDSLVPRDSLLLRFLRRWLSALCLPVSRLLARWHLGWHEKWGGKVFRQLFFQLTDEIRMSVESQV